MEDHIFNKQLVQIRHKLTNKFLKGTTHPYSKRFLFRSTKLNEFYIVGTDDQNDIFTYFILEKHQDYDGNLRYGDLIYIKNLCTDLYIQGDYKRDSEVTKKTHVYLGNKKEQFMIQRVADRYILLEQQFDDSVEYNELLRLVHGISTRGLLSHDIKYKCSEVSKFNEVCASTYQTQDYHWELVKISQANLYKLNITVSLALEPLKRINLVDENMIIIRNYRTSFSLHSHNYYYKTSKQQEVTCSPLLRDKNDFWIVYSAQGQHGTPIFGETAIRLRHLETNKYLTSQQNKCDSDKGYQVTCIPEQPAEVWKFVRCDHSQEPLCQEIPFVIIHQASGRYLAQTQHKQGNWEFHQEIALVQTFSGMCVWLLENISFNQVEPEVILNKQNP